MSQFPATRLAISLPHLNRTDFLRKHSLNTVLHQSVPATVIVCDQGETPETASLMEEYADNPLVIHLKSKATCLWENWKYGADWAINNGFELFSFLQDDDCVHYRYVERILNAFDKFPEASAWSARLTCCSDPRSAIWYSSNGPMVPMDVLNNGAVECPGDLMAPISYLTSWALSPAVAFRCDRGFADTLNNIPRDCDLYTERAILALAGLKGSIICDPCTIGLWCHHKSNECYTQRLKQKEQTIIFMEWIDNLMDTIPNWEDIFSKWCQMMPNTFLNVFMRGMDGLESRYVCEIGNIMMRNMQANESPPSIGTQAINGAVGHNEHEALRGKDKEEKKKLLIV